MKLLLFCWKQDKAGMNMYNNLMRHFNFAEVNKLFDGNKIYKCEKDGKTYYLTQTETFFYESWKEYNDLVNNNFSEVDFVVSLVYHKGVSGPLLTLHALGNFTEKGVSSAPAKLMKGLLLSLKEQKERLKLENFEVMQEVTHGYPVAFDKPVIDFEIGTNDEDHTNEIAGKAATFALMNFKIDENWKAAIGFGGLHYASKFLEVNLKTNVAVGHIFASNVLEKFDKEMLQLAIKKTKEKVEFLVLDKKEKGPYKQLARIFAEELGLKCINEGELLQVGKV